MVLVIQKHLQNTLPWLVAGGSEQTHLQLPSYSDTQCVGGEHLLFLLPTNNRGILLLTTGYFHLCIIL